ncbi:MAG: sulfatase-like hydrolase/transferase, partial [bacterium]|nr:sulfatase-like hydrolase/transferase [bacterium]
MLLFPTKSIQAVAFAALVAMFASAATLSQAAPDENKAATEQSERLNVLFIISDDLTATALSCYGNKVCKTPNIDRLASRGVRFTRAYCQGTYCGPSRASFMSGYYPHATGILGYISPRKAIGDRVTWAQHFKNSGYYSARVSKIFHMG